MFDTVVSCDVKYNGLSINYSHFSSDASGRGCISEIILRDGYRLHRFKEMRDEVFFDVGGNNGLVSIILALQNPGSKVVVVEPISELCEIIEKNIRDNGISNVILLPKAFHSDLGGTKLFLATTCSGASTTHVHDEKAFAALEKQVDCRSVETITFDALCANFVPDESVIKLLKIDCEGGEYALLQSSRFKSSVVEYLEGEFHDTEYGGSQSASSSDLFEYCKSYVMREMQVTKLTRMVNFLREDTLHYRKA